MQTAINLKKVTIAHPFIKWAGGKSQLLQTFTKLYPTQLKAGVIKTYIEPFVGGGAVLFDVLQNYSVEKAVIFDINKELINTYNCIKTDPNILAELLYVIESKYISKNDEDRKEMYYEIRNTYNSTPINGHIDIEKAVDFIFLNRTCFNGLYRVNKSGHFNVPMGSYKNPKICDYDNIIALSELLQKVEIFCGNYKVCDKFIDQNSFIYFDPPYRPLNTTSSFTSYSDNGFDDKAQIELAEFYIKLNKTKAKLMLSNSDPKNVDIKDTFFDDLFNGFNVKRVSAKRMINSDSNNRGNITEILVTNY